MPHRVVLTAIVLLVGACAPRSPETFQENPVLTVGHGAFIAPDGREIVPDLDFVRRAQAYYISTLRTLAKERTDISIDEVRAAIAREVKDPVIADAVYLDWLIDATEPDNAATLRTINSALRWRYLKELSGKEWTEDQRSTGGLGKEVADKLRSRGIKVQAFIAVGGSEYIRACAVAGVPVPPPVFTGAWFNRGTLAKPFISQNLNAEVMYFQSTSPLGACLALPRYEKGSDQAQLFGLICVGTQSRNACFWDNPRGRLFQKNVPVGIEEFVGGVDLVANGQGVCTDCHAGENPYVIHPDDPAFSGITSDIMPNGWYRPLVDASWPQNPGPTNALDAVASTSRCTSCHRAGSAGRFPDASSLLPGWCSTVFGTAVGGGATNTMPPAGLGPQSNYSTHIDAIKNLCKRNVLPGTVVTTSGLNEDPTFISPPYLFDPIYACATKVGVRSGIYNAKVTVTVNGTPVPSVIVKNPDLEEITVPALRVGDVVEAVQDFAGTVSGPSSVTARDHKVDYPSGLPEPGVDPELIHQCANVVAVRHVPTATVTLFINGGSPSAATGSTDWTTMLGGKRPFAIGDSFTAEQSMCADTSPRSTKVVKAVAEPALIPAPTFNPPLTYNGQQLTTLESLVHGALAEVREVTAGPLGNVQTPVSWWPNFDVATPLGRSLALSDQLRAQQALCTKGPESPSPPAVRCETLPPPRIAQPIPGATYVVVLDSVPGARIHIFDAAGKEIGDGSGTFIVLSRAVVPGDPLTAVQQIGECRSRTGFQVTVSK